jgi:hypothetical protein
MSACHKTLIISDDAGDPSWRASRGKACGIRSDAEYDEEYQSYSGE